MHGKRRRKESPLNFVDAELSKTEPTIEKTVPPTPPTTSTEVEAESEGANKMQNVNESNSDSKNKMVESYRSRPKGEVRDSNFKGWAERTGISSGSGDGGEMSWFQKTFGNVKLGDKINGI